MPAGSKHDVTDLPCAGNSNVVHCKRLAISVVCLLFIPKRWHDVPVRFKTKGYVELQSLRLVIGEDVYFVLLCRPKAPTKSVHIFDRLPESIKIAFALGFWLAKLSNPSCKFNMIRKLIFA